MKIFKVIVVKRTGFYWYIFLPCVKKTVSMTTSFFYPSATTHKKEVNPFGLNRSKVINIPRGVHTYINTYMHTR